MANEHDSGFAGALMPALALGGTGLGLYGLHRAGMLGGANSIASKEKAIADSAAKTLGGQGKKQVAAIPPGPWREGIGPTAPGLGKGAPWREGYGKLPEVPTAVPTHGGVPGPWAEDAAPTVMGAANSEGRAGANAAMGLKVNPNDPALSPAARVVARRKHQAANNTGLMAPHTFDQAERAGMIASPMNAFSGQATQLPMQRGKAQIPSKLRKKAPTAAPAPQGQSPGPWMDYFSGQPPVNTIPNFLR